VTVTSCSIASCEACAFAVGAFAEGVVELSEEDAACGISALLFLPGSVVVAAALGVLAEAMQEIEIADPIAITVSRCPTRML
jgi:hypothetical protein